MLKKFGVLILLLLLCLAGCGEQPDETGSEAARTMYFNTGTSLWEIKVDGSAAKRSAENCSVCVDGVVYEVFGSQVLPSSAGAQTETWGIRVDGEVVYEEHYYFEEKNDVWARVSPMTVKGDVQVVGEYIYFLVHQKGEDGARLCSIGKDGTDLEIYEDFLTAPEPLLSDGNTVYFKLLNEDTTVGYPAKLDKSSGEAVILAESEANIGNAFWIASGKLWWQTSTEAPMVYALHSARALGGEMEEYPEFTGQQVYQVSGTSVYYRQENNLSVWDFTKAETRTYPVDFLENGGLVAACDWGGLLCDDSGEIRTYWLLDFDTGELSQVFLE